eukprot:CAMPEP_0119411800 /NCGR_PEP_ID=MMETSP1335-20130426/4431_1 /TAXON_ID=259385 /ORGANISM="Chrysoculter rhomboideus, Strain RCC1486" /LENGTH=31 /DNA_ID= /DNA_START= /DNA_END= /DNA_ORIENTATION=
MRAHEPATLRGHRVSLPYPDQEQTTADLGQG